MWGRKIEKFVRKMKILEEGGSKNKNCCVLIENTILSYSRRFPFFPTYEGVKFRLSSDLAVFFRGGCDGGGTENSIPWVAFLVLKIPFLWGMFFQMPFCFVFEVVAVPIGASASAKIFQNFGLNV